MPRKDARIDKTQRLRKDGCLNPHPEQVKDPLFVDSDFFDSDDLVQVKYEMLRRVQVEQHPVAHSAKAFGFSRPSFYQALTQLRQGGLSALVRKKPGPRRAHKLDAQVVGFLHDLLADNPDLRAPDLAARVHKHFGKTVHPRSIERALAKQKKKRP